MGRGAVSGIEVELVKEIARQVSNYDKVLEIVNKKDNFLSIGEVPLIPWKPTALSHGIPGICMLYGELHAHFPEEGWDDLGHKYLSILVNEIKEKGAYSINVFRSGWHWTGDCLFIATFHLLQRFHFPY